MSSLLSSFSLTTTSSNKHHHSNNNNKYNDNNNNSSLRSRRHHHNILLFFPCVMYFTLLLAIITMSSTSSSASPPLFIVVDAAATPRHRVAFFAICDSENSLVFPNGTCLPCRFDQYPDPITGTSCIDYTNFPNDKVAKDLSKQVDVGQTALLFTANAAVGMMTIAIALFYSGLSSETSIMNTIMLTMVSFAITQLLWVLLGYSIAFGPGNSGWGNADWGAYTSYVTRVPSAVYGPAVPHILYATFQGMFCAATASIISGSVVQRFSFRAYMLYSAVWTLVVYAPLARWPWALTLDPLTGETIPLGWLGQLGFLDTAGGLAVHTCGGFSALAASLMVGTRLVRQDTKPDVTKLVTSICILWGFWFFFNGATLLLSSDGTGGESLANTHIATCTSLLAWTSIEYIHLRRISFVGAMTAILIGLVSITAGAGFISNPLYAAAIGLITSVLAYLFNMLKSAYLNAYLDDTLDVFLCHGFSGYVGTVLVGFFADDNFVAGPGTGGLISGRGVLIGYQLAGVTAGAVYAFCWTCVICLILKYTVGIRVTEEEEILGLDRAHDGNQIEAYDNNRAPKDQDESFTVIFCDIEKSSRLFAREPMLMTRVVDLTQKAIIKIVDKYDSLYLVRNVNKAALDDGEDAEAEKLRKNLGLDENPFHDDSSAFEPRIIVSTNAAHAIRFAIDIQEELNNVVGWGEATVKKMNEMYTDYIINDQDVVTAETTTAGDAFSAFSDDGLFNNSRSLASATNSVKNSRLSLTSPSTNNNNLTHHDRQRRASGGSNNNNSNNNSHTGSPQGANKNSLRHTGGSTDGSDNNNAAFPLMPGESRPENNNNDRNDFRATEDQQQLGDNQTHSGSTTSNENESFARRNAGGNQNAELIARKYRLKLIERAQQLQEKRKFELMKSGISANGGGDDTGFVGANGEGGLGLSGSINNEENRRRNSNDNGGSSPNDRLAAGSSFHGRRPSVDADGVPLAPKNNNSNSGGMQHGTHNSTVKPSDVVITSNDSINNKNNSNSGSHPSALTTPGVDITTTNNNNNRNMTIDTQNLQTPLELKRQLAEENEITTPLTSSERDKNVRIIKATSKFFKGVRLRVAVHHGKGKPTYEPEFQSYTYSGIVVEAASIIRRLGHGGQSLVSKFAWDKAMEVEPQIRKECMALNLGELELRRFRGSTGLLQVLPKTLSSRKFPPLRPLLMDIDLTDGGRSNYERSSANGTGSYFDNSQIFDDMEDNNHNMLGSGSRRNSNDKKRRRAGNRRRDTVQMNNSNDDIDGGDLGEKNNNTNNNEPENKKKEKKKKKTNLDAAVVFKPNANARPLDASGLDSMDLDQLGASTGSVTFKRKDWMNDDSDSEYGGDEDDNHDRRHKQKAAPAPAPAPVAVEHPKKTAYDYVPGPFGANGGGNNADDMFSKQRQMEQRAALAIDARLQMVKERSGEEKKSYNKSNTDQQTKSAPITKTPKKPPPTDEYGYRDGFVGANDFDRNFGLPHATTQKRDQEPEFKDFTKISDEDMKQDYDAGI